MSTTTSANEHSKRSLAAHLGRDISTIRSRLKPFLPSGEGHKARYSLKQVMQAFAPDYADSDAEISYSDQLKISQKKMSDFKLAVLSGEYVHKSKLIEAVHKVAQPTDQIFLTMADQIEFRVGMTGAQMECLNQLIREFRATLLSKVSV